MGARRTIRVLLADDDDLIVEAERALLESDTRIEVIGRAHNGCEAVELERSLAPDVVLMDIEMPVLDGVEATQQIRGGGRQTAIVAISGSDYQERALEIREAGADDYLRKDRLDQDLLDAVVLAATRADAERSL
jgi:DNA-binding NarL/FixJ family response regulator